MNSESTATSRPLISVLLLSACAAMLALGLLGIQPLRSTTYWWYVATGEAISTWEAVPDLQLFLFSVAPEQGWVYDSWLGSVVLATLHDLAGAELTLLTRNILSALSVAMVAFYISRRQEHLVALGIPVVIAIGGFFFFVPVEPVALALPLATLAMVGLFSTFGRPERFWAAALLPAAILVVINLHLATAVALMVIGVVAAIELVRRTVSSEQRTRRAISAGLVASSPLCGFGFVYGPDYWTQSLMQLFSVPDQASSTVLIVSIACVAIAFVLRSDDQDLAANRTALAALVASSAAMAIFAPATTAIFAIVLALTIAAPLSALDSPSMPSNKILAAALVALSILAICVQPGVDTRPAVLTTLHSELRTEPPYPGLLPQNLPLRCAEELRRTGRTLRVFHDPDHGGFLLYHLLDFKRPHRLLFDDHRRLVDDPTAQMVQLMRQAPVGRGYLQQLDINAAVFSPQAYPTLADELKAAPEWYDLRPEREEWFACYIHLEPGQDN